MKKVGFAVLLSLYFGCGEAMAMSPFSEGDVKVGQTGISEMSPVAGQYVDLTTENTAAARLAGLEKAVDRYLYQLELLKRNPEVARAHAVQMTSIEKKLVEKLAKEVDAGIHIIARHQLSGRPLDENDPICQQNRELLSLYGRMQAAKGEFDRLLQAEVPIDNLDPINQADADYIAGIEKTGGETAESHRVLNEIRYALSRLREKIYAGASNDDLTLTLNWLKRWFNEAEKSAVEVPDHLRQEYDRLLATAKQQLDEQKKDSDPKNVLNDFVYGLKMLEQRIAAREPAQQINATMNWTKEHLGRLKEAGVEVPQNLLAHYENLKNKVPESNGEAVISDRGKQQMAAVVEFARRNNGGYSGGDCFEYVWRYLYRSGYGNISKHGDLPRMQSDWARHFSDFLNAGQANLDEAGLQRLDTTLQPVITNPHDPRIPVGAVIVVAPGSYGTAHRYAGDIVVKAGDGHFINDGPRMDYGTGSNWYGKILGVYVPK